MQCMCGYSLSSLHTLKWKTPHNSNVNRWTVIFCCCGEFEVSFISIEIIGKIVYRSNTFDNKYFRLNLVFTAIPAELKEKVFQVEWSKVCFNWFIFHIHHSRMLIWIFDSFRFFLIRYSKITQPLTLCCKHSNWLWHNAFAYMDEWKQT